MTHYDSVTSYKLLRFKTVLVIIVIIIIFTEVITNEDYFNLIVFLNKL